MGRYTVIGFMVLSLVLLCCSDSMASDRLPLTERDTPVAEKKSSDKGAESDDNSAVYDRIEKEKAIWDNPFAIVPHQRNYILPLAYNFSPNPEPYNYTDGSIQNTEVKFQISFKVPLWNGIYKDIGDLYFAYTNLSLWQAYNSDISSPFRETNHEPELFVVFDTDRYFPGIKSTYIILGISHQSNGRSGSRSRSWNRVYANFLFSKKDILFSIKPWYRLPESEKEYPGDPTGDDNPDIHKYMGYGEFNALYRWENHVFSVMLRNNLRADGNKGAVQLDWSLPLPFTKLRGYVQYFNGYGESLIDYNHSTNRIGIGIELTGLL